MRELVRTNNAVLITAIEALLKAAEIPHVVLDQHMSVLEGSLGILPRRILVDDDQHAEARALLQDAGLAHELRPAPHGQEAVVRPEWSHDAVLDGRLKLFQKKRGHRIGHDAILLAAATGAHAGDRVADLGSGVGAAGLALAIRVPDVAVTLIELDPELVEIASENISSNGLNDRVRALALDVTAPPSVFEASGLAAGSLDGVMMNPPFNDPDRRNVSPDARRRTAHDAPPGALDAWIGSAAWLLHSAGILTMIWRADGLPHVLEALCRDFGGITVLPVYGKVGQRAIRVLVRASKGSRTPFALLPGLELNDGDGRPTTAAEDVLRRGQALPLAQL